MYKKRKPWPLVSASALVALGMVFVTIAWLANRRAANAPAAMAKGQYNVAAEYYTESASEGNPAAQNSLASLYYLGLGVEQDFSRAATLYLASAGQGYAPAQLNLGHLYKQGLGVNDDPVRAFAWYHMSHIHGNPPAEIYLTQVATEYSITPNQIDRITNDWSKLSELVAEGL